MPLLGLRGSKVLFSRRAPTRDAPPPTPPPLTRRLFHPSGPSPPMHPSAPSRPMHPSAPSRPMQVGFGLLLEGVSSTPSAVLAPPAGLALRAGIACALGVPLSSVVLLEANAVSGAGVTLDSASPAEAAAANALTAALPCAAATSTSSLAASLPPRPPLRAPGPASGGGGVSTVVRIGVLTCGALAANVTRAAPAEAGAAAVPVTDLLDRVDALLAGNVSDGRGACSAAPSSRNASGVGSLMPGLLDATLALLNATAGCGLGGSPSVSAVAPEVRAAAPAASAAPPVAAIAAGCVVASIFVLCLAVGAVFMLRRRRRKAQRKAMDLPIEHQFSRRNPLHGEGSRRSLGPSLAASPGLASDEPLPSGLPAASPARLNTPRGAAMLVPFSTPNPLLRHAPSHRALVARQAAAASEAHKPAQPTPSSAPGPAHVGMNPLYPLSRPPVQQLPDAGSLAEHTASSPARRSSGATSPGSPRDPIGRSASRARISALGHRDPAAVSAARSPRARSPDGRRLPRFRFVWPESLSGRAVPMSPSTRLGDGESAGGGGTGLPFREPWADSPADSVFRHTNPLHATRPGDDSSKLAPSAAAATFPRTPVAGYSPTKRVPISLGPSSSALLPESQPRESKSAAQSEQWQLEQQQQWRQPEPFGCDGLRLRTRSYSVSLEAPAPDAEGGSFSAGAGALPLAAPLDGCAIVNVSPAKSRN